MRAGRDEVLNLFRVWQSEGTIIRCDFLLKGFAASLRGRVRAVSDTEMKLLSDDTFSELTFRVASATHFEYTDARDFPEDANAFEHGLVAFLPTERGTTERDTIVFLELK